MNLKTGQMKAPNVYPYLSGMQDGKWNSSSDRQL